MDVAALAKAAGLHATTARFHLDVPERTGLVRRAAGEAHRQLAEAPADALAADPDAGPGVGRMGRMSVGADGGTRRGWAVLGGGDPPGR